jgi:hypothetical protein
MNSLSLSVSSCAGDDLAKISEREVINLAYLSMISVIFWQQNGFFATMTSELDVFRLRILHRDRQHEVERDLRCN